MPRALPQVSTDLLVKKVRAAPRPSCACPITPEHFPSQEALPKASPPPPTSPRGPPPAGPPPNPTLPVLTPPNRDHSTPHWAGLGRCKVTSSQETDSPTFHHPTPGAGWAAGWGKGGWALNRPPLSSLCPGRGLCHRPGQLEPGWPCLGSSPCGSGPGPSSASALSLVFLPPPHRPPHRPLTPWVGSQHSESGLHSRGLPLRGQYAQLPRLGACRTFSL